MRSQSLWVMAAVIAVSLVSTARGAVMTENFASSASAAANGWTSTGDGVEGAATGFSNSADAGGAAGEGRALLTRGVGATKGYRDTTLGGILTSTNPLSFSGKLDVLFNNPDVENVVLGYTSTTNGNYLGVTFILNQGTIQWGVSGVAPNSPGGTVPQLYFALAGLGASRVISPGVDRTFDFTYDPTANGGNGRITASISGAGDPVTVNLTASDRALFNNARFDAFGISHSRLGLATSPNNIADYRIDDVSYTVVPEPSAAAAVGLAVAGMLTRRRRRVLPSRHRRNHSPDIFAVEDPA